MDNIHIDQVIFRNICICHVFERVNREYVGHNYNLKK